MLLTSNDALSMVCHCGMGAREDQTIQQYCIAKTCMAWRWHYEKELHYQGIGSMFHIDYKKTELGYCGLAGKPEGE